MECRTSVLESQLDWLTASFHTRDSADRAKADAERWARFERDAGAEVKPFRLGGYQGWLAGRVRFGQRLDGALLQLSGDLAERHCSAVCANATNVSRVDVAVTAKLEPTDTGLAVRHYVESTNHRGLHPSAARPLLNCDGDGGSTVYLGDRASNWFLRVYNKEAECIESRDMDGAKHYAGCWRYELEVKGADALRVSNAYQDVKDRPAFCQVFIHQWASNHGLLPVFPYNGGQALTPGFRRRSDRETRLRWLAESVRPAVEWLSESTSKAELISLLGLADSSQPPTSE